MDAQKRKRNDSHHGGRGGRGRGGRGGSSGGGRHYMRSKNDRGSGGYSQPNNNNQHRWGGVMSQPPKLKLQSHSPSSSSSSCQYPTVSIAIPGSVVSNAQTRELQTQLAGQIARAAAVFRIDEVIIFDDGLGSTLKTFSNYRRGPSSQQSNRNSKEVSNEDNNDHDEQQKLHNREDKPKTQQQKPSTDPHIFLTRILQYIECPQYLRRKFFPMHPDLQFAGLLPPLDAPHHLRRGDVSAFREGVVVIENDGKKKNNGNNGDGDVDDEKEEEGSLVDCGVPNRLVRIDRVLTPGIRCTVQLDIKEYESKHKSSSNNNNKGVMKGKVVSPTTPRDEDGIYWGYATRLASSINAIFEECPYDGGYDLKVGTSERGDVSIDSPKFCLRKKKRTTAAAAASISKKQKTDDSNNDDDNDDEHFNHLLIVFGGVAGIEESVDADETMTLSGEDSKKMFDVWVNICPYQGSRTIRSEEAVFIALAKLSPFIAKNGMASSSSSTSTTKQCKKHKQVEKTKDVEFSDEDVSEESSDDDE